MQILGIALAMGVAILWGLADSIATMSARRQATFMTTLIAQITGLIVLTFFTVFGGRTNAVMTIGIPVQGLFMSALTGICAAVGYFALYRAMEKGPLAITSPLSSTSALVTLAISMVILGEQITMVEGFAIAAVLVGVILVSTRYSDLRKLLNQQSIKVLTSSGVRWACVAAVAFGLMDFAIGAMSPLYGWFAPVFWIRISSVTLFLSLFVWQWSRKLMDRKYRSTIRKRPASYAYKKDNGNVSALLTSSSGVLFAVVAGVLESTATLAFSIATGIIQPGGTATIASSYSVVAVLFGIIVFRERISISQSMAIVLVVCGLAVLTSVH